MMNLGEGQPLLNNAAQKLFARRIQRSTAIAIALICCGVVLSVTTTIQASLTKMSRAKEVDDGTQPFTIRLVYLFIFVGGTGAIVFAGGLSLLLNVNDPSLKRYTQSHNHKMVWAAVDLHAWAVGALVTGSLSAAASLIAIVAFQNYNTHQTFQFNVNDTVGWLVIGSTVLITIGLASAADLDSRAILGTHFKQKTAASSRVTGLLQTAFSLLVLLLSVPLPFTMTDIDGLAIAGILASVVASLFGLWSGHRITHAISRRRWHHQSDADILYYERAWGLSVACHCLSLMATGLHVYFAIEIGVNCVRDGPKQAGGFRPSCDSDVGILAGILPHVFGSLAVASLGITSILASVRVAKVVEDLVLGNHSDGPINMPHDEIEELSSTS
eukprot:TRINITY_DN12279_c1_g1_i6.p1 TRINITY_DN12279_c1_g1~~TRINITY_DN12279_c1_g1_i6.p1  ORF type:complete len:385 (+),score=69.29 TRINITY_DN12279_c1_g1_i6:153-1307(+)